MKPLKIQVTFIQHCIGTPAVWRTGTDPVLTTANKNPKSLPSSYCGKMRHKRYKEDHLIYNCLLTDHHYLHIIAIWTSSLSEYQYEFQNCYNGCHHSSLMFPYCRTCSWLKKENKNQKLMYKIQCRIIQEKLSHV